MVGHCGQTAAKAETEAAGPGGVFESVEDLVGRVVGGPKAEGEDVRRMWDHWVERIDALNPQGTGPTLLRGGFCGCDSFMLVDSGYESGSALERVWE